MSSLVDATFRTLLSRFQRGGTTAETTTRPEQGNYRWIFKVREVTRPDAGSITVEVGILAENVYKIGDTAYVTVSDLVGTVPSQRFEPGAGNAPSVERVDSYVRAALAGKLDQPPHPAPPPPPVKEICSISPEPMLPTLPEEPVPLPQKPRKRDGGFKHPNKKGGLGNDDRSAESLTSRSDEKMD